MINWEPMLDRLCESRRGRVRWEVRTEDCADHPGEPWLKLTVNGAVLMETCTGTIRAYAEHLRGREMIQIQCSAYDHRQGVSLFVRSTPCNNHEGSEWLTLYDDGIVLFSGCVRALDSLARLNRGKDLISLLASVCYEEAATNNQENRDTVNPHV